MAYREEKAKCEGCNGPLLRPSYDDWGRFVCATCVAKGSLLEADRRAAESEAGSVNLNLSDNPYRAAQQMRGILAGVVLLLSFFMCGGMASLGIGLTFFREGRVAIGLGLMAMGGLLMVTPLLFAAFRVYRASKAGAQAAPPSFDRH